MIEYKALCRRCGREFTFRRKAKISPTGKQTQYCVDCRKGVWNFRTSNHNEPRYVDSTGYAMIKINGIYVSEHRYIMEQKLNRKLQRGEVVHHIDGNKTNNLPQNLELWVRAHSINGSRAKDLICPHCGKSYLSS